MVKMVKSVNIYKIRMVKMMVKPWLRNGYKLKKGKSSIELYRFIWWH
jgi:hypothetical protein